MTVMSAPGGVDAAGSGAMPMTSTATSAPGGWARRVAARAGAVVLGGLLTCCAGLSLHRTVDLAHLLPIVLVGAFGPAIAVLFWSLRPRPMSLWLAAPAATGIGLVVVSATLLRGQAAAGLLPDTAVLRSVDAALRDSWREVFSVVLPVGNDPAVLVTVAALVWFAGYVAAEAAVRTRSALGMIVAPAAILVAGLIAGVDGPGSNAAEVAGFVAVSALILLVRGQPRAYLTGVPLVAVVALVAMMVGPALPIGRARPPLDLRHYVSPVEVTQPALDPLDQVSAWLATPQLLFTVTASSGQDWRVAVLDGFDGTSWHMNGQFEPTGSRVPELVPAPPQPILVSQHIRIEALTGVWVPAATSAVRISGTPVVVDPQTGVLLSRDGLRPGLSYDVTSEVRDDQADQLLTAVPANDAAARADLEVAPGLPDDVRALAQQVTAGAAYPFQQATRLENYLRTTERYDLKAPPGHTYGHLAYFLDITHRGTSEQFATAFAVMARTLGLPTRVVVGFEPGVRVGGDFLVQGTDALAWPEIDFRGLGWVPFFPTPNVAATAPGGDVTPAGSNDKREGIDSAIDAAPAPTPAATPGPYLAVPVPQGASSGTPAWVVAAAAAGALVVGYLVAVLGVPPIRRRSRRRSRDPGVQVLAAWRETLWRLRGTGLTHTAALTTGEVAGFGSARLGDSVGTSLRALGGLADAVAYSDLPPRRDDGAAAWRHADVVASGVRRAVRWRTRLRQRLGPRALLRR
jgi:transglutaminase-like putative cysteine protease